MLQWIAVYNGGETLSQYNEDGTENKYGNIDRARLERFLLMDGDDPIVVLNMDQNKKLIYRRRTAMDMFRVHKEVVYIVGWQETLDGGASSTQNIVFYFASTGHIEVTDGFREDHEWFYPVIFLPEEEL